MRRFKDINQTLLFKWLWLFGKGGDKLWMKIIKEKYITEKDGWFTKNVSYHTDADCGEVL